MGYIAGSGFTGSSELQTSVAGQEIISNNKQIIRFSIMNQDNCNISVNGGDYVFIPAYYGVNLVPEDFVVQSVKIQQSGIEFNWAGVER